MTLEFKYKNINLDRLKENYEYQIKDILKQIDKLYARKEGLEIALEILLKNTQEKDEK